MSDSRERFEAWIAKEFPCLVIDYAPLMGFYRGDDGFRIGDMWDGWQAAERDALERAAKVCEWKQDTDYETEIWHTSCGEAFVFNEGGPDENFLKFCCYCGVQLKAIRALAGNG